MNAPLPKGWKEFTDDQGQSYFHHETKNETSWDHPLDSHVRLDLSDQSKSWRCLACRALCSVLILVSCA